MPTEKLVWKNEDTSPPPLYQLLYNSPGLPAPTSEQQRLRCLIWLHRMNLNGSQLALLESLRKKVVQRQKSLEKAEKEAAGQNIELETPVYNNLWDALKSGVSLDDPSLQPDIDRLQTIRENQSPDIMLRRIEAIRGIIDAEQDFLRSLSPEQEHVIIDTLFFLRHKLDPIAHPQDFSLLVGSTYEPGQYAVLLRGTSELARQSMNIGGLWTDEPELTGQALHEARREVLLYLALLEPGLDEAIRVAQEKR